MKRLPFIKLLKAYYPHEQVEKEYLQKTVEFVINNESCFERTLKTGHITASGWLLNKNGTHALLMHHNKLDRWLQLGGHCDGEHDVLKVAIKECMEESGIKKIRSVSPGIFDIDVHTIPNSSAHEAHLHYDIRFLLQAEGNDDLVQNIESKGFMWVGKNGPLPTDSPSIKRMFKKWAQ